MQAKSPKPHLEAFIDWLSGTFPSNHLNEVIHRFHQWGIGTISNAPFRPKFHERAYQSNDGLVTISHKHIEDSDNSNLELNATALRFLEWRTASGTLSEVFEWLWEIGFVCRRIDLTCDDYSRSLPIREIKRFYDNGWVQGFQNTGQIIERGKDGSAGLSMAFGNRGSVGSGKRFVFYDKFLQSKGKIDAIRAELSIDDERAQTVFTKLCNRGSYHWPNYIRGLHADAIRFIDEEGECPDWWANYLDGCWEEMPKREPISPSFERLFAWLDRQVGPSLRTLYLCYQSDRFLDWVMERIEAYECSDGTLIRHHKIVQEYQRFDGLKKPNSPNSQTRLLGRDEQESRR